MISGNASKPKLRILIVDDDKGWREILSDVVSRKFLESESADKYELELVVIEPGEGEGKHMEGRKYIERARDVLRAGGIHGALIDWNVGDQGDIFIPKEDKVYTGELLKEVYGMRIPLIAVTGSGKSFTNFEAQLMEQGIGLDSIRKNTVSTSDPIFQQFIEGAISLCDQELKGGY
ncbi:hypothetical protein JW710_00925 [Candidatus Dojkabacteria bacterium]|nr:hypothetical protein [Candidatus Dojkabacteria bacterium]